MEREDVQIDIYFRRRRNKYGALLVGGVRAGITTRFFHSRTVIGSQISPEVIREIFLACILFDFNLISNLDIEKLDFKLCSEIYFE